MKTKWLIIILALLVTQKSNADDSIVAKTVVDDAPIASARTDAMAGAVGTSADDLDAAFQNPAGIGGLMWGRENPPSFRKLYFPYLGATLNNNSKNLNKAFRDGGVSHNREAGEAVIDAASGKRQYARASILSGAVYGRSILFPFSDAQVAAVSRGNQTNAIDANYRSFSGIGYGFSAQDPSGQISLGYFGYLAELTDTRGLYIYEDIIDSYARKKALRATTNKYSGHGHNLGLNWMIARDAAPTLAVSVINAGDTNLKRTSKANSDLYEPTTSENLEDSLAGYANQASDEFVLKKELRIGFSIAPNVGSNSHFLISLQGNKLNQYDETATKKYALGTEYSLGGFSSYHTFALRAGVNHAGLSGGASIHAGILGFEIANKAIDIGSGNNKVIERRTTGIFLVNVADF